MGMGSRTGRGWARLLMALGVLVLVAAGCGDDGDSDTATAQTEPAEQASGDDDGSDGADSDATSDGDGGNGESTGNGDATGDDDNGASPVVVDDPCTLLDAAAIEASLGVEAGDEQDTSTPFTVTGTPACAWVLASDRVGVGPADFLKIGVAVTASAAETASLYDEEVRRASGAAADEAEEIAVGDAAVYITDGSSSDRVLARSGPVVLYLVVEMSDRPDDMGSRLADLASGILADM